MRAVGSTYRVQVRPDADLDHTASVVDYLDRLGVTHLYSAPLLAAIPGSAHGYDVVDPTRVNPELGGPAALDRLVAALRRYGLGLVVDIVPNHVGVAVPAVNPAWWSVLRDGPDSPYSRWFDIDWSRGPLLIPVLGDDDGEAITVDGDELRYHEHRYPIAPGTGGGSTVETQQRQHYRLVHWRRGNAEVNYRRFFAISDLAAVRVEDPDVFAATHAEILRWVRAELVDGIRVDHPDGLRDPGGYLRDLRQAVGPLWIVVEKILEYGEELPPDWPVDGSTGYEALREVGGVFIDPAGDKDFPATVELTEVVLAGKRAAGATLLATEVTRLLRLEPELAAQPEAGAALVEVAAQLPVYRTYLPAGVDLLEAALQRAAERYPDAVAALAPLLLDQEREIAIRFQQFSGAVMAKGVEDTAYYRWNRFIALNEVGGAPDRFGVTPAEFHAAAARRASQNTGMTTLSTHDTKRGEDVRARLAVLAEIGPQWQDQYGRWVNRHPLADPDIAALLWQTVVGAWPIEPERLHAYATKAAREAATTTGWDDPNAGFEQAMHDVIDAMYGDPVLRAEIDAFVAQLTPFGWSNSLGQKLVQLTMPGVPDTYQGTELWDNSLVDPDNRRPVDFGHRRQLLHDLDQGGQPPVDGTGAAKLLVTSRALRLRRDRPDLFTRYDPVPADGPHATHVLAFDRGGAVSVATRLPVGLAAAGGWEPSDVLSLPGSWRDQLTGRDFDGPGIGLAELLSRYPVALLARLA